MVDKIPIHPRSLIRILFTVSWTDDHQVCVDSMRDKITGLNIPLRHIGGAEVT